MLKGFLGAEERTLTATQRVEDKLTYRWNTREKEEQAALHYERKPYNAETSELTLQPQEVRTFVLSFAGAAADGASARDEPEPETGGPGPDDALQALLVAALLALLTLHKRGARACRRAVDRAWAALPTGTARAAPDQHELRQLAKPLNPLDSF